MWKWPKTDFVEACQSISVYRRVRLPLQSTCRSVTYAELSRSFSLLHTQTHRHTNTHTHPCNPALCLCSRTTASVPLHPNKVTSACRATECCNMIDKHRRARCCRPETLLSVIDRYGDLTSVPLST